MTSEKRSHHHQAQKFHLPEIHTSQSRSRSWSTDSENSFTYSQSIRSTASSLADSEFVSRPSRNSRRDTRGRSKSAARGGSATRIHFETPFSSKAINNQLLDIVQFMEYIPKKAYEALQKMLQGSANESERKRRFLIQWVDTRGLDLLQCAIIHRRVDIIKLLLKETELFPPNHYPKLNPYGHLAAVIGCKHTLEAVLSYRPNDFFPASGPQHVVKLPPDVARRLQIPQTHGMVNKYLERLVNMVKSESAKAARSVNGDFQEQSILFEEEIANLEKSFKEDAKKSRRTGVGVIYPGRSTPSSSLRTSQENDTFHPSKSPKAAEQQVLKRKGLKKTDKVTVFMDMNDPSLDIRARSVRKSATSSTHKVSSTQAQGKLSIRTIKSLSKKSHPKESPREPNIELGVRRIKRYKTFTPVLEGRVVILDDPSRYMGKTPLTLAAEKNHYDCVRLLLEKFQVSKRNNNRGSTSNALYLATDARSIEAIAVLMKTQVCINDYRNAVALSLNRMYPNCLSVLLNLGGKLRNNLFDEESLFHILYTTIGSCDQDKNVELLPEMTRVLINCKEDVNPPKNQGKRHPLYTLIQAAFRVNNGQKSLYFVACFRMLLNEKADPHYNEEAKSETLRQDILVLSRPTYVSAFQCILFNAHTSLKHFQNKRWSFIIMQRFIETLEMYDKTPRRVLPDDLFHYMGYVTQLGLNRHVVRTLLRYGANPDHALQGKYPINAFFDEMYSFLTRFEVNNRFYTHDDLLNTVLLLCRAMTPASLQSAVRYFLNNHLLSCPLQALGICRKFSYYANAMIVSPRSLTHIVSLYIWIRLRRNSINVRKLPVPENIINFILP